MGWHLCRVQLEEARARIVALERELREARSEIEALEDENARILAVMHAATAQIDEDLARIGDVA